MKIRLLLLLILTALSLPVFANNLEENLKIVNYNIGYNLTKIAEKIPETNHFKKGAQDALNNVNKRMDNSHYKNGHDFITGERKIGKKQFRVLPEQISAGIHDAETGQNNKYREQCRKACRLFFGNEEACQEATETLTQNQLYERNLFSIIKQG